jgi:hypothetical protein
MHVKKNLLEVYQHTSSSIVLPLGSVEKEMHADTPQKGQAKKSRSRILAHCLNSHCIKKKKIKLSPEEKERTKSLRYVVAIGGQSIPAASLPKGLRVRKTRENDLMVVALC